MSVDRAQIEHLRESMDESTMDDRWCAKSVCEEAIDALEASRAEVAALRRQLATARDALRGIWPFIEEDDGGFATSAYQSAIDDVRASLERKEEA